MGLMPILIGVYIHASALNLAVKVGEAQQG